MLSGFVLNIFRALPLRTVRIQISNTIVYLQIIYFAFHSNIRYVMPVDLFYYSP